MRAYIRKRNIKTINKLYEVIRIMNSLGYVNISWSDIINVSAVSRMARNNSQLHEMVNDELLRLKRKLDACDQPIEFNSKIKNEIIQRSQYNNDIRKLIMLEKFKLGKRNFNKAYPKPKPTDCSEGFRCSSSVFFDPAASGYMTRYITANRPLNERIADLMSYRDRRTTVARDDNYYSSSRSEEMAKLSKKYRGR